jgi:hypothetical protein
LTITDRLGCHSLSFQQHVHGGRIPALLGAAAHQISGSFANDGNSSNAADLADTHDRGAVDLEAVSGLIDRRLLAKQLQPDLALCDGDKNRLARRPIRSVPTLGLGA